MIRFGPAGWDYDDWWGIVYPDPAPRGFDPLAYLARFYDTVEVNSTFYRPMPGKVARGWCSRVAHNRDFRFTAKLSRRFTHDRAEAFSDDEVGPAREAFEALAEEGRLGAVLLQFPWSFRREGKNREWLHDVIHAFAGLPLVVEVRHASWNVPEVYESLAARRIGFVNIDQPLFHDSVRPSAIATAEVAYIRVHGRNYKDWFRQKAGRDERYDYLYTAKELEPWAARTRALATEGKANEVYVVTNNHFRGQAAANATMLESMVRGRKVEAPRELLDHYADALAPFVREAVPAAGDVHAT